MGRPNPSLETKFSGANEGETLFSLFSWPQQMATTPVDAQATKKRGDHAYVHYTHIHTPRVTSVCRLAEGIVYEDIMLVSGRDIILR